MRPVKQILSLESSIRMWNRCVEDDLAGFVSRILILRPRFSDLIKTLSERSRDPLRPPLLSITRAVMFSSILQGRFGKIYQNESIFDFVASSLPSPLSLTKLDNLPVILQDVIQIYSSTPSRQRRILPKVLKVWDEHIIERVLYDEATGFRARCWMNDFRDRMAIDLALLYGHLKLLTGPREEFQVTRILSSIFDRFLEEGKEIPCEQCDPIEIDCTFDDAIRWRHRWDSIAKNERFGMMMMNRSVRIFESVLFWFRSMVRAGLTGHSFNHFDWQHDEIFATPPQSNNTNTSQQYTSFTMNTTEIDSASDSSYSESSDETENEEQFYFDNSNIFT